MTSFWIGTGRRSSQQGQTTLGFLALGLALAVGLVLAAWIVAGSLERIKLAGDKIVVKGYAEEKIVSDAGSWRAIVTMRGSDLESAYRGLESNSARLVELIGSLAGDKANLQSGVVNTQPIFEFGSGGVQTGRITGAVGQECRRDP